MEILRNRRVTIGRVKRIKDYFNGLLGTSWQTLLLAQTRKDPTRSFADLLAQGRIAMSPPVAASSAAKSATDFGKSTSIASNSASSASSDPLSNPTVQIDGTKLTLLAQSTAWISSAIDTDQPVNFINFTVAFTSQPGAEGLLSIYWEGQLLGSVDERFSPEGDQQYTFDLPQTYDPGTYALGFRLDPFTGTESVAEIDQVATGLVTPEPGTFVLLAPGGLFLFACAWRRRKQIV